MSSGMSWRKVWLREKDNFRQTGISGMGIQRFAAGSGKSKTEKQIFTLVLSSGGKKMKKIGFFLFLLGCSASLMAAYQYNTTGNQLYLTFDSSTTLSFDLSRSGKTNDHENFIDRGEGVADYGWYNLDTGSTGSLANGEAVTFGEDDRIGLYLKDNNGEVFTTTKSVEIAELGRDITWGKSDEVDGSVALYGGNKGSNGSHEYYVFKVSTANANGAAPSGQPLPGIIATLLVGGGTLGYLKLRKKLYASKSDPVQSA